jgi:hypothetical protein
VKRLSELVDDEVVRALRERLASGSFPGIPFHTAMEFLLSDGIMPESGLPVASLLELEDWVRARARAANSQRPALIESRLVPSAPVKNCSRIGRACIY